MKFTAEIDMDNASFEECPGCELRRILSKLLESIKYANFHTACWGEILRDINGNLVGEAKVVND